MECGLQWKDITCWDEVPRLTLTHEETLEAAIPDYCPDMGLSLIHISEPTRH